VVRSDGSLAGYRWGLAVKESLLAAAQLGVEAVESIHRAADAYTFIKPETALATRPDD
jgi:hypothetical protein